MTDWNRLKRAVLAETAYAWRELQDEVEDGLRAEVRLPDLMERLHRRGVTPVPRLDVGEDGMVSVAGITYVIEADGEKLAVYASHTGLGWKELSSWGVRFDDGDVDGVGAFLGGLEMSEADYKALPRIPDRKPDRKFLEVAERFAARVKEFGWLEILPKVPSKAPEAVDVGFTMMSPKGFHKFKSPDGLSHEEGFRKAKELAGKAGKLSDFDARTPALATKVFYDDGSGTKAIQNSEAYLYEAFEVTFRGTVEDVGKVWRQLKGLPRWHIVRGGLVDGGKRPRSDGWFRRHASMEPGTNDIVAKPRNLLILDIDKKPTVDGSRFLDDPAKAIRAFLDAYGPPELRGVSFAYDLSSSCGVVKRDAEGNMLGEGGELINCHVEILMDRPVADETLAAWILAANARAKLDHGIDDAFDARALVTSQPIYTAAPLLVNVERRLEGPAVGISAGTAAKVDVSGIDVDRVTADMLDLDRRLTEAGLERPKGFRAAVGRARAAEYMRENGIKPEDRAKVLEPGSWTSRQTSGSDDFAERLRSTLKLESGGILQPLQNAVGRHIARCRGNVDVDVMVNDIMAAGVALAGSVENAVARNKNLGPAAARSLVETYLINYRVAQSEFPGVSDGRNALVESPALSDDPAEAAESLRALMTRMGDPTEIEGTGRRWRLEMDLAGKLCETFTVNAAARALSDGADIPPREAIVMCMKAVLEPSLTKEQWRRKSELLRAYKDVSHIRPFPHVQKARLEKLAAWLKTSGAEGWTLNRETGVVAVEWPAGRILTLTAPEKWASGGYNSVSDTDAMPLIVQPTRNVAESAGVWGSPPTDLDHVIHVFRLPSEAAEWMKQAEEPVRCISYGGFADLRSRDFLAGFAAEQVDRGAKGVVIHASDIHAQGIAAAIAAKGVPVAAPGIDGYQATLGEGLKDRSLDAVPPASSVEEEIEDFDPDNLFGTETVAEMQARWTGGTALERAKAKGIPM